MENNWKARCISVVVVGCVESTKVTIEALVQNHNVKIYAVVTTRSKRSNSDYVDLSSVCFRNKIRLFFEDDGPGSQLNIILQESIIDLCFVVGWSKLIPLKIFQKVQTLAIGYHPTLLPKNRGRHPIIWSIVLGLRETGSTFFELAEDADAGDILNQKLINIDDHDTSRDLYNKLLAVIPGQIDEIISDYSRDALNKVKQNNSISNQWRKRSASDGLIDWRMSSALIYNLVRALVSPYPGADFVFNRKLGKVYSCELVDYKSCDAIEPGRVLDADDSAFQIKTGDGALLVKEYVHPNIIKKGDYL